jgi:diguanylate cyclase (GGDEF)-like protein
MLKTALPGADATCMRPSPRQEALQVEDSQDTARQICCSMTSVLLRLVRDGGGERAIAELLERSEIEHEATYLENVDNWVSLDDACALLEAGAQLTGDPSFARRVGEQTLRQHAGTQVATVLRSLGSTEAVLQAVAQTATRLSTVTKMETVEVLPGHAVVRAVAMEGFTRRRIHCEWATGLLAGTPILFGLPLARVAESECQARGGAQCLYTVSWDAELAAAGADPQQRVTSLEAQLAGMSERLQNVYATASDLISTEDLDTALRRIVERAANAVRTPSHILAVRTSPDAELQVYSHGIDEHKAQALARAAIAHEAPLGDSTLVVEVTSSRRQYGQLIARYPGTTEFFPQEEELLSLYAKHAAAVLDMATALEESARRHSQVSSLLSLSHALAEAGTSEAVAERLGVAIPEVVDCDRIAVWLWDDLEQKLRCLAASGRAAQEEEYLRGLSISPQDTPNLSLMISVPEPQFFEKGTDDRYISELMTRLDVVALVVVPIVARDSFLGTLTVSVTDRPERLRSDSELLARLTGVAALAATAIQNGQLVDMLEHKASHDALTGLLNRVGFRRQIGRVLAGANRGGEQVGLLFVDLDDFKKVNDAHGHEAGDELIRKAALRLEAISRASDEIARLGGDEFAIVLGGVQEEQVRAAEGRVRAAFVEPFLLGDVAISVSASVGGGLWPEHGRTVQELVRHADGAMYKDKARGRRPPVAVGVGPAHTARSS